MSTAEVGLGGPSAPRWGSTFATRLQAAAERLRAGAAWFLETDEGSLAARAAALAAAPQAVPNLPPATNKRLVRAAIAGVAVAHAVLLLALWRSAPPPPPAEDITVELVREVPKAEPKPAAKPEPQVAARPVQDGKDAGAKDKATQTKPAKSPPKPTETAKQEPQAKPEEKKQDKPKPEEKPKAQQKAEPKPPKAAHHRARPAPPQPEPPKPQPAAEQTPQRQHEPEPPRPEQQIAMPAIALPGASDTGTDAVSYSQLVLSQVAKAKKQGRYMGVPGYAGVRFRVGDDGSLEMVKLVVSSGAPTLDIEAEAMIRRAAPFPKPPPGGRRDYGITLVFAAQPE